MTPSVVGAFLDALAIPTALLDRNFAIVALNAAWRDLAAETVSDEAPPSFDEGSPWLPRFLAMAPGAAGADEALTEGLRAVAAAERPCWEDNYFYSSGGEDRCLTLTLSRFNLGGISGILVQSRRATEPLLRRQAQAELREARERFDRMMAATREGVFLAENGRILDVNPAALEMLRYTAEQLIGMEAIHVVAPESLETVMQRIRARTPGLYDATMMRSDGSRFTAELMASAVPYQGRTVRGTAVRDVTDRVQAEAALRESEERFRLLAELTSEAIVIIEDGRVFDVNTALADLIGRRKEDILGQPVIDLIAPDSRALVREAIMAKTEVPYEANTLHADGTPIPVLVKGRMLPFRGRMLRGTTLRDLRLQRQAEAALRRSIAQEEKVAAQAAALAQLSTPVIPISDRIMVMPLVGVIDEARAENVVTTLLEAIRGSGATIAILDVTGVPEAGPRTADGLVRAARAARLIGAEVVLTGIRAEVARALVELGADLSSIPMRGTLQSGIAYAMMR